MTTMINGGSPGGGPPSLWSDMLSPVEDVRALHVNDYAAGGGAEVLVDRTLELLRTHGIEVDRFTIDDVPGFRRTAAGYVDCRRCRRALRERLAAFRPQIVHLHNFYHVLSPGILAELQRWKRASAGRVVMTAHDYHLVCPNSGLCAFEDGRLQAVEPETLGSMRALLGRRWDHRSRAHSWLKVLQHVWSYRLRGRRGVIDCVICPSRFMEDALRGAELPTAFLPHPAPAGIARHGERSGDLRYVFAGRVEPEKGLAEFLALVPSDARGTMDVLGEGSELERCRAVCGDRGLSDRVRFAGRVPHEQALARIAAAHVLLLPSRCPENYPMSLLEALAMGTNVLASNLGGMREMVQASGVGFLFRPGAQASVEQALRSVEQSFDRGALNSFDASAYLRERSDSAYVAGLLALYRRAAR